MMHQKRVHEIQQMMQKASRQTIREAVLRSIGEDAVCGEATLRAIAQYVSEDTGSKEDMLDAIGLLIHAGTGDKEGTRCVVSAALVAGEKQVLETLAEEEVRDFIFNSYSERWFDAMREKGMLRVGDGGVVRHTDKFNPRESADMFADITGLPPDDEDDDDEGEEWKN